MGVQNEVGDEVLPHSGGVHLGVATIGADLEIEVHSDYFRLLNHSQCVAWVDFVVGGARVINVDDPGTVAYP